MTYDKKISRSKFATKTNVFLRELLEFNSLGKQTVTETVKGIPYFVNEFWTAKQRQSNSIHEISYRACFKAQLPEFFIARLTNQGDTVFDPFMGRGTTPVQAAIMGREAYGNDINPLSTLLTRPRLRPVTLKQVEEALCSINWDKGVIERRDLLAFYHPEVLKKLESLRLWVNEYAPINSDSVDPVADWIRMVAISRLSGHSSGFFSGRSMPPNQAVSVRAQQKINEKYGISPPNRDVASVILKKSKALLKDGGVPYITNINLSNKPAWDVTTINDASVDLTVTSPPFLDIVDYAQDNWLRCWFAGIDTRNVNIDKHKTEEAWSGMVRKVLIEQARVVKPGGYVAFEVGEVRNKKVMLERLVWAAADGLPFHRIGVMVNKQEFTKTANCWGITNGKIGTNTNRIVLLQRHWRGA